MQNDSDPVIRSSRLKQLIAKRASNPQMINQTSVETSSFIETNLSAIPLTRRLTPNSNHRQLPDLPKNLSKRYSEIPHTKRLNNSKEIDHMEIKKEKVNGRNITERNNNAIMMARLSDGDINLTNTSYNVSTARVRREEGFINGIEGRQTARESLRGDSSRRRSSVIIEAELNQAYQNINEDLEKLEARIINKGNNSSRDVAQTTENKLRQRRRSIENETNMMFENRRQKLDQHLVQPNPSPRRYLREGDREINFSAEKSSVRETDISGELLASPAGSEEGNYQEISPPDLCEFNRSPRIPSSEQGREQMMSQWANYQQGIMCPEHPNNVVNYICLQDRCGDILCYTCTVEHDRRRHIGAYELLQNFKYSLNEHLAQAKDSLMESANEIAQLESEIEERKSQNAGITDNINKIEEKLINYIKEYFMKLREEYKSKASFELKGMQQNLNGLRQNICNMIKKLEEDLFCIALNEDNPVLSAQTLSRLVTESYGSSPDELKQAVTEVHKKVQQFAKHQENAIKRKNGITLQAEKQITTKLHGFLVKNIRLVTKEASPSPNHAEKVPQAKTNRSPRTSQPTREKENEIVKVNEIKKPNKVAINKKVIEPQGAAKRVGPKPDQAKRDGTPVEKKGKGILPLNMPEVEEEYEGTKKGTPKWKGRDGDRNIESSLWDFQEEADERFGVTVHQIQEVRSSGVNTESMRSVLNQMEKVYNTEKIKVIDDEFFERLFNYPEPVSLFDFMSRDLYFENVKDYLQVKSTKGRNLFTVYDKVFFLANLQNSEWMMIEVRKSPKMILLYDFLGQLGNSFNSQNILDTVFDVIKHEYKTKLGQNIESHMWERKVAVEPCLSYKDPNDTGILALKIIANEYKNRGALKGKVSLGEIKETRKMLQTIFEVLEAK